MSDFAGLDPMGFAGLLDALATWVRRQQDELERRGMTVVAKDDRRWDKWSATVEVEASQRVGYLTVWSSGELDCQVLRAADFFVLNEHRLVQDSEQLEAVLTTFLEVVGYGDPREPARGRPSSTA